MNHPLIPETSPDVTSETHGFLALCRTVVFFGDVLQEHLLAEHQFGDESLEPLDLAFEFPTTAVGIDLCGVVPLPPTVVGRLGDVDLPADVRDRQPLGQVAVEIAEQSRDSLAVRRFFMGPSLADSTEGLPFQVDQFLGGRPLATGREEPPLSCHFSTTRGTRWIWCNELQMYCGVCLYCTDILRPHSPQYTSPCSSALPGLGTPRFCFRSYSL